ncbi:uncharacterized protein LOC128553151 isoform X2 [Mercenaria mercenaria]|uniref:uncharacterized protein LOC128553151 isoform X2 n=1 Tax=Mercenaria mercenaria TaxID=6596 RepID=UPI00234E418D|nr:uncharacterized protein LOC128553151 isoform X2 [Mercenaria mercenaria]
MAFKIGLPLTAILRMDFVTGNRTYLTTLTGYENPVILGLVTLGQMLTIRLEIAFEGVRGDGSKGDIAVDDISIIPSLCSLDCDFDDGFCNWMQDDGDDFDWTLQRGPTETSNTGPEADHTPGNGQYAYIDSSQGTRGDEAWLMSPLQNAGKFCFSFWYYMYGEDVDRLVVGQLYRNGTAQVVFRRKGNQGRKWFRKQLFVHTTTYFMIVFDGRVSDKLVWWNRDNGDIAIDDVQMVSCQDCENPIPKNALANSTNFEYGSVIEITCNTGFTLVGKSLIVCQTGGSWSATPPACNPFDCGHRTIPNGKFNAAKGTTFGQTATYVCNIGYTLFGDMTVICTATGWNSTNATCEIIDAENDTLIAVYVLVPVIVVILAILFIILLLRRRLPNCKKVSESKHESRKNPVMTASNKTYTGVALESQNYTNNAYEDGSAQLNDEYATITDEQNVNSNNLYYNIAGAAGTSTEHDAHNYDHTNETAAHFVDESYSHVSGNKNAKTFEPSYSTTLHMNSGKESDYDHAHAGGIDPVALDKDDYSHLNDLNIKQKCRASFGSGNDDEFKYSYANENSRRTGKEVEKSKAGYKQERSLKYELQDTINDDRHYFVLEAEEVKDDNHGSDNHDYFVLEETES